MEVEDLVKTYPKAEGNAVDGVSFTIRRGEIFGLLGPNGAGKTTIVGVLTTAVRPTSGAVRIAGVDVADSLRVKPRIAVMPQINNLDRSLKAREVLTFHAAYHGVPKAEREARADRLLTELGLAERANEKVPRYSGGMAQRLMLARALMHDPEVLFLDEPTNNLDPQSRHFLWDRIRELNARGVTIVLTTHDMNEAEQLCDRVAVVDHGKVLVLDSPDELKKIIPGGGLLELHATLPDGSVAAPAAEAAEGTAEAEGAAADLLRRLRTLGAKQVEPLASDGDGQPGTARFRLFSDDAGALVPAVIQAVGEEGAQVRDLRLSSPSLEDVFIHLTGRNLRP
ncbi:ABC transporter ATP-binding protein [Kitasatospora xanthocidica]|uniref:ABC transporter ATP-binding protein n=1 Tax=Kitasatospora xanthocidica TaxID=83382 RepID=UPI0036EAD6EE